MTTMRCDLLLCVAIAIAMPCLFYASNTDEIQQAQVLLTDTLRALKSALLWFDSEYKRVNLDGIIGTRIVEGQLKVLLRHIDHNLDSYPIDSATLQEIRDIQDLATQISDKALPYVQASDPPYYNKLNSLIQANFWTLDFASKDFTYKDLYGAWLPQAGEVIHEEDSDNCISELLGTGLNAISKCQISTRCWKMMTSPGYSGYSLTHQIFYLEIAYRVGCAEEMDRQRRLLNQVPPGDMINQFCAAIYLEAKEIDKNGFPPLRQDLFMEQGDMINQFCAAVYLEAKEIDKNGFPPLRQDLFLEQAALCGIMGYRWFFSPEWLEIILQWQDRETGCYKGRAIAETQVAYRDIRSVRAKREERLLDHGCLCHRTTVAASALTMYVRYIVEYEQMMFQQSQVH